MCIRDRFCQVQGVRGAGEWDLGWGWHMATKLMGEAFEPGDPRRNATLLYFRHSTDEPITPENTKCSNDVFFGNQPGNCRNGSLPVPPAKRDKDCLLYTSHPAGL